jgi:hypothetical protein
MLLRSPPADMRLHVLLKLMTVMQHILPQHDLLSCSRAGYIKQPLVRATSRC